MAYTYDYKREMAYGSRGEDVKKLQTRLKELGYYNGDIDGSYGKQTTAAVKKFQKDNGFYSDGVVGKYTGASLQNEPVTNGKTDFSENYISNSGKELRYGSKGQGVQELQKALKTAGYYSGELDGLYGSKTKEAVMQFQKDKGLKVDGIAGSETKGELQIMDRKSKEPVYSSNQSKQQNNGTVAPKTTEPQTTTTSETSMSPKTTTTSGSAMTSNNEKFSPNIGNVKKNDRAFREDDAKNTVTTSSGAKLSKQLLDKLVENENNK